MFEQYLSLTHYDIFFFLKAIGMTLWITLVSITIGTLIGIVMGLIRCSKNKIISAIPLIYIEPLRNSPLVTQLFLTYYGLPVVANIVLDAQGRRDHYIIIEYGSILLRARSQRSQGDSQTAVGSRIRLGP